MTNCLVRRVRLTGATPLPTLSRKGRGRNNQLLAMTLRLIQRYWVKRFEGLKPVLHAVASLSNIVEANVTPARGVEPVRAPIPQGIRGRNVLATMWKLP